MLIAISTHVGFFAILYAAIKISDARDAALHRQEQGEIPDQRAIAEEHAAKRMPAKQRKDMADLRRGTSDNVEVLP